MRGSEKQIDLAGRCIEAAKAHYAVVIDNGVFQQAVDADGSQRAAIDVLEAIDRGDYAAAEALLEKAAPWWELCLVRGSLEAGEPQVDAGAVIDRLKKLL